jgi:hypothetical protein
MSQVDDFDDRSKRTLPALAAGGAVGIVVFVVAAVLAPKFAFPAWLVGFVFVWSFCVGSLALTFLFTLTGGQWGEAGRRQFSAAARMTPLLAIAFLPIAIGIGYVYPWTAPDFFDGLERVANRRWYFQTPFFLGRSLVYFALWSTLSILAVGLPFRRRSSRDDRKENSERPRMRAEGQLFAGVGLVLLVLSVTWATNDWMLSLNPFFVSTTYGLLVAVGAAAASVGLTLFSVVTAPRTAVIERPEPDPIRDLGNLFLAGTMLWAYLHFSQFLICWSGNLPDEADWYLARTRDGWGVVAIVLALCGFALPLVCLPGYRFKDSRSALAALVVAWWTIRALELAWLIFPAYGGFSFGRLSLVVPAILALATLGVAAMTIDERRRSAEPIAEGSPSDG